MDGTPIIQLRGLSFVYPDGHQALADVSLDVMAGERVALVGPNGAGKSTLLLQLNGILVGRGEVRIAGLALSERTTRVIRGQVGLVFQDPDDQLFSPTVFDDVAFGPLNMGLPEEEVLQRAAWALDQVRMGDYARRMPHHLSLGEKKKVAIATVLSMTPAILALDEPSAGLDPDARENLLDVLGGLSQTMMIATHDLDFVRRLCTRVVTLERGRIVADALSADPDTCGLFPGPSALWVAGA